MQIKQTLTGLGFTEKDYHRPIRQLSGGQRTRALLAQLLLESPDLLMLDEPTNHLDIQAVEWLESFLKDWDGALVVVSHDRYFLDQVARTIWEMTPALETYRGNYSAYLTQREERYARGWRNMKHRAPSSKKNRNSSGAISPVRTPTRPKAANAGWNACWKMRAWPHPPRNPAGCTST